MAYGRKRRGGSARGKHHGAVPAREPEKGSEAMELLRRQAAEIDENSARKRDFTPKPKAIRKYERFANMGD